MSGRHRPTNGADSEAGWQPVPWRVLMQYDRYDADSGRFTVDIPAAIGIHDAINQARDQYPNASPLRAELVTHEDAHVDGACAQCSLA